jgi:hypothetical protein
MGDNASAAKRARQDYPEGVWWEKYERLKLHIANHKRLPNSKETDWDFKVGKWIDNQRQAKKGKGHMRITAEQIRALEALPGWHWGQGQDLDLDTAWHAKLAQLKAYVANHGCIPTQRETIGDFKIGRWINFQRKRKGMGRLTAGQIQALETLPGWKWKCDRDSDAIWHLKFAMLKAHVDRHGRLPTRSDFIGNFKVGIWIDSQRQAKKGKGGCRITAEQIQALETLPGWYWEQDQDAVWREKFGKLEAYVAEHGRLPTSTETIGDFKVGNWLSTQRQAKKGGRITAEQIQALETIPGWRW